MHAAQALALRRVDVRPTSSSKSGRRVMRALLRAGRPGARVRCASGSSPCRAGCAGTRRPRSATAAPVGELEDLALLVGQLLERAMDAPRDERRLGALGRAGLGRGEVGHLPAGRLRRAVGRRSRCAPPCRATARPGRARAGSSRPSARPRRTSPAPRPPRAAGRAAAAARARRRSARSGGRAARRRPGRVRRRGRGGRRPSRRPRAPGVGAAFGTARRRAGVSSASSMSLLSLRATAHNGL